MSEQSRGIPAGYSGWFGANNLGDEAFLHAIRKHSSSLDIKPSKHAIDADISILGGGTILPLVFQDDSVYHFKNRDLNVALGVGVIDPEFENPRRELLDVRWLCGKLGYNTNSILERLGLAGQILTKAQYRVPGFLLSGVYCTPEQFRRADEALDIVTVRGPDSKRILEEHDIQSSIIGDTALLLEPDEYITNASEKVVISLRPPGTGRKWTNNGVYISAIIQFCNWLPDDTEIVFLPFHPSDIPFHKELAKQITNAKWRDYTSIIDIPGVLHEITSAEVVIGEKLHACVFSACCHTPFVSLEYAPKNEDFAASIGMEEFNIRIDQVDTPKLLKLYQRARELPPQEIQEPVNEYRIRLRDTITRIEDQAADTGGGYTR